MKALVMSAAVSIWLAFLIVVPPTWAADSIGTVIGVGGSADIGRGGKWEPASKGGDIKLDDELRTGGDGAMKVVFADDSVLTLDVNTLIVVDEFVYSPKRDDSKSGFNMLRGKVRSLVSEHYKSPLASFRVTTPTATAGVRGTDFFVIYDPVGEVTDVVTVTGTVVVHALSDLLGPGVVVRAREISSIVKRGLPSAPKALSPTELKTFTKPPQRQASGGHSDSISRTTGSHGSEPDIRVETSESVDTAHPPAHREPRAAHAPDPSTLDRSPGTDTDPGSTLDRGSVGGLIEQPPDQALGGASLPVGF